MRLQAAREAQEDTHNDKTRLSRPLTLFVQVGTRVSSVLIITLTAARAHTSLAVLVFAFVCAARSLLLSLPVFSDAQLTGLLFAFARTQRKS